jgi:hypothetical protein
MKTVAAILAVALAVGFSAPAFSAEKMPKTQASCEKAGMTWDTSTKKCKKP